MGSIPLVMDSTSAHVMLWCCGYLHRRPGNLQRAENSGGCSSHPGCLRCTLPARHIRPCASALWFPL